MSDNEDNGPRWKWTQVPDFRHPDHPQWDLIQWDLEDELVWKPREVAKPVSGDPTDEFWYVVTKDAPGLDSLPHMVVLFKIASDPTDDEPGILVGLAAWEDNETLVATLSRRVRDLSSPS